MLKAASQRFQCPLPITVWMTLSAFKAFCSHSISYPRECSSHERTNLLSYGLPHTLQIIYIIASTTGTDNWGVERTLASIPAVYATSMILPKFSHTLGIDVGIIPGLDANKKVTDSSISNEPFCYAPTSSPVIPSCTAAGHSGNSWMCPNVFVSVGLGECLLCFQII